MKRHLATHLNSTLLPSGTATNQHHNNPQQQQPQQQTLVSHHLSQLPHLQQQQQHPQVQEQLHELQVPYDPNKFYINVNTNSS